MDMTKLIAEKYKLDQKIGQGGWSQVYSAKHVELAKPVAIKLLDKSLTRDEHYQQRFEREAQILCKLNHPNINTVFDYGLLADGQPYVVLQLLKGNSLSDVISAEGALDVKRACNLFIDIADAVAYAHKSGVLHRDIKPSNVMICMEGDGNEHAVVLDFGLAKTMEGNEEHRLTMTGETVGTPAYMSPEQCLGKQVDARSDVYSLGCLMYETIAGQKPFDGDNAIRLIGMHLKSVPPAITKIRAESNADERLGSQMKLIVSRMLEKEPADRFQSMVEVATALRAARQGTSAWRTLLEQCELLRRGIAKWTRKPSFIVVMALLIGAIAAVAFGSYVSRHQPVLFEQRQSTATPAKWGAGASIDAALVKHDYVAAVNIGAELSTRLDRCPATVADITTLLKMSDVYSRLGRYQDCRRFADKAEQLSKQIGDAGTTLALQANALEAVCLAGEDSPAALASVRGTLASAEKTFGAQHQFLPTLLRYQGLIELELGQYEQAVRSFDQGLTVLSRFSTNLDPAVVDLECLKYQAMMLGGHADQALAGLQALATRLSSKSVDESTVSRVVALQAQCQLKLGHKAKALALFEQAVADQNTLTTVYPEFLSTLKSYAELLSELGYADASAATNSAIQKSRLLQ